jgi:hypothetical protein
MSSAGRISRLAVLEPVDMLGKYAAAYVVVVELIDDLIATLDESAAENVRSGPEVGAGVSRLALAMLNREPEIT